jgi:hypothetical protein
VFEGVALGVTRRILPDRLEHRDEGGKPIEPISDHGGKRSRWIDSPVNLAADLGVVRETVGGDPATGNPSCRTKYSPTGIGAPGHLSGRLASHPLPESIGRGLLATSAYVVGHVFVRVIRLVSRHGDGSSATGRQRMPRISAVVA